MQETNFSVEFGSRVKADLAASSKHSLYYKPPVVLNQSNLSGLWDFSSCL